MRVQLNNMEDIKLPPTPLPIATGISQALPNQTAPLKSKVTLPPGEEDRATQPLRFLNISGLVGSLRTTSVHLVAPRAGISQLNDTINTKPDNC